MSEVSSLALGALVDIDTCLFFGVCNEDDVHLQNLMNEFFIQNDDKSSENGTVMKGYSYIIWNEFNLVCHS